MTTEYKLSIVCVDGAVIEFMSNDPLTVSRFLEDHDHEGSCVSLDVRMLDPDEVYAYLTAEIECSSLDR